jgi:serine O-acetyltransferase
LFNALFKILNVFILQFIFNCDIPSKVKIGKRIRVPHPYGIIISPETTIGDDFTCFHQVTIGFNESKPQSIVIGNKVYIGTGAKIIGIKSIGNYVNIGANAVVIRDIDDHVTAVGIYK